MALELMQITSISPEYSVAPQITAADVPAIAEQGFRTIMCNRPDGEDPGQPEVAEIRAAAEAAGLAFAFVPVASGNILPQDITGVRSALAELPTPVLAYCRSGTRSRNLWALTR
jgi:sulfide:quinone oxidoreductase